MPPTVGKAAPRRHDVAVDAEHARAGDAAARVRLRECEQRRDRAGFREGVRISEDDELARRLGEAAVRVRGEAERPLVLQHARSLRHVVDAARDVADDDELVDLRGERRQRDAQLVCVTVRDNHCRDARHRPSTSR